jgi:ABC-type uncharacterized transport system substrate-binding protein
MITVIRRLTLGVLLILSASAVLLVSDLGRRTGGGGRVRHLAILQHSSQPVLDQGVRGMIDGLAEQGFVEGKGITIRRYSAENDLPTANAIAKEITDGRYDLVLTASTLSLQVVANANRAGRVRHVFGLVSDPAGAGVGISRDDPLEHPGHLAGYGTMQPVAQAFQLARRLLPGLRRVGVVWNPAESNSEAQLTLARAGCAQLSIELLEANADNTAAVMEAASSLVARDVQAIWAPGDVTVLAAIDSLVGAARTGRVPVFTSIPGNAPFGTLFDLGADYHEVGRLAGVLAAQVLQGTDPATVPVQNVMPETLLVNRAALAGLKDPWQLPDDVLRTAQLVGAPTPAKGPAALARTWNVNILEYVNVLDVEEGEQGIRAGLTEAGLVEGRDYRLTVRNAQGDMPTLSALVDAAVGDAADMLITLSTPTLQAALQRGRGLPIVFTFVADAIAAGAGRSNEDHLANVTGVPTTAAYEELLALVRECLPSARRLGTLYVPSEVNSVYNKDQVAAVAPRHGFELVVVAANTSAEVADATLSLLSRNVDAICQVGGNLTTAAFASIAQPAQRARVPVFGFLTSDARNGAAVVAARDYFDGGREAGLMAARIMRGENPAAMPFQPLRTTRIVINRAAARAARLALPETLLQRATDVIGDDSG